MADPYHIPVLASESIEHLAIQAEGTYVDLTFGGGGHSQRILEKLSPQGQLVSFDQDTSAYEVSQSMLAPNFRFVQSNFRFFSKYLKLFGHSPVDGILADLGISSHQIDTPQRGFSTRFDAPLDMRMNAQQTLRAEDIVASYSESQLQNLLGMYGEVRNARTLAQALVRKRLKDPIKSTEDLKNILRRYAPRGKENRYFAQVFQALRIEVNDELGALKDMLLQCPLILKPGGRLVILSYHSLEDRPVKNFIQKGKFTGEVEKDLYGNFYTPLSPVIRKALQAGPEEQAQNPRSRSVRLRVAERNPDPKPNISS